MPLVPPILDIVAEAVGGALKDIDALIDVMDGAVDVDMDDMSMAAMMKGSIICSRIAQFELRILEMICLGTWNQEWLQMTRCECTW